MNFLEDFQNKTILIPRLQRDYVQGGREDIISTFLDSLLFGKSDLNYIYGYKEDDCFVPIDGQQRLTTLWLLYLYIFSRKGEQDKFNISLQFHSREYAQDFCIRLKEHLGELLSSKPDYSTLDKAIKDQYWFITSWYENATVRNALSTLKHLHRKISDDQLESIWNHIVNDKNSITFAFLEMNEKKGLDDDIYVKMNGRGRALSMFENLKSWMDEKISNTRELDEYFKQEWKRKMDNSWTMLFWNNRNLSHEHPEEIDDEQLACFCNFLILYHSLHLVEFRRTIENIKDNLPDQFEELLLLLDINENAATPDLIIEKIFDRLRKTHLFSLVWIERLELMPIGYFRTVYSWVENLYNISEELNTCDLYIGQDEQEKAEKTYQIAMCESSYNRTLPLLYAVVSYEEGTTSFYDWMRVNRNFILNTDIQRENLPIILKAIGKFSEKSKDVNIYDILKSENIKDILKGFNNDQIKEESLKSSYSNADYYQQMIKLENGRFFSGRIGVIFNFLRSENSQYDPLTPKNFKSYTDILLYIFTGETGGIKSELDNKKHLLRRALMSYFPYRFGIYKSSGWCFCNDMSDWRKYVNSNDNNALRLLIKELLVKSIRDFYTTLDDYVEGISANYENDIKGSDPFRFHFIHHPGVWDYMGEKQCKWEKNHFDIRLLTKTTARSKQMDLRTYCLYLDYKYNELFKKKREGWNIGLWEYENTCFYFEKKLRCNSEERTIAIDVFFYDDNRERKNENCYAFCLFVREFDNNNEYDIKGIANLNNYFFSNKHIDDVMNLFTMREDRGRFYSKQTYSREGVIIALDKILSTIEHNL